MKRKIIETFVDKIVIWYYVLEEIGITPTDNQKKLIDDFIQEGVNDLGNATPKRQKRTLRLPKYSRIWLQYNRKMHN